MTNAERYIAQGRAHDAAKKLRSELATLRTWFEEYTQSLATMEHIMSHFLRDPREKAADGRPVVDHLNQLQRELSMPGFFDKTAEFIQATTKLRNLEEQIKDF
jgi:hypothetical protein